MEGQVHCAIICFRGNGVVDTGNREVGKIPDLKFSLKCNREIKYSFAVIILTLIPVCGFFPHTKLFSDTSWVSYSSTQF